jgi:hypothetical protein
VVFPGREGDNDLAVDLVAGNPITYQLDRARRRLANRAPHALQNRLNVNREALDVVVDDLWFVLQ